MIYLQQRYSYQAIRKYIINLFEIYLHCHVEQWESFTKKVVYKYIST